MSKNCLFWRPAQTSCNGRVHSDFLEIVQEHCHFPEPDDIEKFKFRKTLKDRETASDVTPRQTIFATQHDVNWRTAV